LRIADLLEIGDWGLRIDWGLGIGDWGLRIEIEDCGSPMTMHTRKIKNKSAIRNPQSAMEKWD
jgi:hypothetical protein